MPRSQPILVDRLDSGQGSRPRGFKVRWCLLLSVIALLLNYANSEFLSSPTVAWTYDLPASLGDGTNQQQRERRQRQQNNKQRRRLQQQRQQDDPARFGRRNAVAVSSDGSQLFITESNGALHIVNTGEVGSGKKAEHMSLTYLPEPATSAAADDGMSSSVSLSCSGGAAIYQDTVVVYAVTDQPASGNGNDDGSGAVASSRILAVDTLTGKLIWTVEVAGTVVGTPWLSGQRLYVVRNTANSGYVTLLELARDGSGAEVVATIPDPADSGGELGWLGPLAGHTTAIGGVERDVVVVALATNPSADGDWIGGGGGPNNQGGGNWESQGGLYAVVPSADYDDLQGQTSEAYAVRIISSYPLLTDLRPSFDGTSVYLAHQGRLSGWEGSDQDLSSVWDGTNQDRAPSWETRRADGDNSVYPCAPVLTPDSALLLVSTPTPGLSCRSIAEGTTAWSAFFDDLSVVEPVVSVIPGASESMVYTAQQTSGVVRQHALGTGTLNWEVDCATVTGDTNCDLTVQADFSSSRNGNMLYYALANGTLVALRVAEFATDAPATVPTVSPSQKPVHGASPSRNPTPSPSLRGFSNATDGNKTNVTDNESSQSNSSPLTLPVLLGAAAGGLLIVIVIVSLFLCRRKQSRAGKGEQERITKEREAVRKWNEEKAAYETACKEQEEEVVTDSLKDLSASSLQAKATKPGSPNVGSPSPPSTGKKKRANSAGRPRTALIPLDSITEDLDADGDGSDAGIEVSIGDVSGDLLEMSDDESLKKEATDERTADVSAVVPPSVSGDPWDVRDLGRDSTSKEDMAPVVRNLASSFSEVADAVKRASENTESEDTSIVSKPDPEPTGSNSGSFEILHTVQDSPRTKNGDASVFSGITDENPVIYRPEDDIVRISSKPENFADCRGRPTSPDFSDVWSADGSLYLDEESKATRDRSVVVPMTPVQPEDEPGMISKGCRPKSPDPVNRPVSQRTRNTNPSPVHTKPIINSAKAVPKSSKPTPAIEQASNLQVTSDKMPVAVTRASFAPDSAMPAGIQSSRSISLSTSLASGAEGKAATSTLPPSRLQTQARVSRQVRGGSARPRAGLFTRRENPLVSSSGYGSDSGSETVPKGYIPEREARAAYNPTSINVPDPVLYPAGQSSASVSKASNRANGSSNQNMKASESKYAEQRPPRRNSLRTSDQGSSSLIGKKYNSESQLTPENARSKSSPSSNPESSKLKTGAYAAWDSFLTELGKVEETFFNPKLGTTNARTARNGRRRQQRHSRRSRSADDYDDSDSDSSFSAGLNPMG